MCKINGHQKGLILVVTVLVFVMTMVLGSQSSIDTLKYMMTELVGLNAPVKVDGLIGEEYCTFTIIEYGDVGDPKAS